MNTVADNIPEASKNPIYGLVRKIVRSTYDLQKLRIQTGNRLVISYKERLGLDMSRPEEDDEKAAKILNTIRQAYDRITDGIAVSVNGQMKLPRYKSFKGNEVIRDYVDFMLANQYFSLLRNEEQQFKMLENVLGEIPIYRDFLAKIPGIGVQMAGVMISEIDIYKAHYVSNIWSYAGLSTTPIGYYIDEAGKEVRLSLSTLSEAMEDAGPDEPVKYKGYVVQFKSVGTSRQEHCLVDRTYLDKDGVEKTRRSITFNPWLKTKLMGVLAASFLKQTKTLVDGEQMSTASRTELAKSLGFKSKASGSELTKEINNFLNQNGYVVEKKMGKYAKIYYDYRFRIENHPEHQKKTPLHRHNMALRYMIKQFLVDYYRAARSVENLPVYDRYEEVKLNIKHSRPDTGDWTDPFSLM